MQKKTFIPQISMKKHSTRKKYLVNELSFTASQHFWAAKDSSWTWIAQKTENLTISVSTRPVANHYQKELHSLKWSLIKIHNAPRQNLRFCTKWGFFVSMIEISIPVDVWCMLTFSGSSPQKNQLRDIYSTYVYNPRLLNHKGRDSPSISRVLSTIYFRSHHLCHCNASNNININIFDILAASVIVCQFVIFVLRQT